MSFVPHPPPQTPLVFPKVPLPCSGIPGLPPHPISVHKWIKHCSFPRRSQEDLMGMRFYLTPPISNFFLCTFLNLHPAHHGHCWNKNSSTSQSSRISKSTENTELVPVVWGSPGTQQMLRCSLNKVKFSTWLLKPLYLHVSRQAGRLIRDFSRCSHLSFPQVSSSRISQTALLYFLIKVGKTLLLFCSLQPKPELKWKTPEHREFYTFSTRQVLQSQSPVEVDS